MRLPKLPCVKRSSVKVKMFSIRPLPPTHITKYTCEVSSKHSSFSTSFSVTAEQSLPKRWPGEDRTIGETI